MEKKFIATGKDFDSAVQAALSALNLSQEDVSIQLLEREKKGVFGFGAKPCKIEVIYEVPDAAPAAALSSASRSKPKKAEPKPAAPAAAPVVLAPKAEPVKAEAPVVLAPKAEPVKAEAPKPQKERGPRPERKPREPREPKAAPAPKAAAAPKEYTPAEPGSVEEKVETFLKGLMEHMGSTAVPHACKEGEDTYRVELVGEDLGMLIGRRGDTLDAIQHLANYSVNRAVDGHIRISVDAEDYRVKREESLQRYARKKAQQVLKQHRRTTLEPMNAYERHVIHAALQDMENITTYSTGTEPNRRVIIEYVR